MEHMEDVQDDYEVFENDIELFLWQFCTEKNIENMKNEPQSIWNAALIYIQRHAFNDKSKLKLSRALEGYNNNNYDNKYSNINKSNCNAYDTNIVNAICDYYIYMCYMYDKEISIMGFSKLTGINQDTIHDWGNKINKLSTSGYEIYKKLSAEREESLTAKLASNKNPVAIISILNKHYGWNLPGVTKEHTNKAVASLEDVAAELKELSQNKEQLHLDDMPIINNEHVQL